MSRIKKAILISTSVLASILCVFCCLYIYQFFRGNRTHEQVSQLARAELPATLPEQPIQTDEPKPDTELPAAPEEPTEPEVPTFAIDIDFDALAEVNEEIYAWLEIPGTIISYPILQSQSDDLFYNTHGVDKVWFSGGSIYTQRYNAKTFDDPMTLVYGHNFHDQSLFAPLLNYIDRDFFDTNRTIYIYTPDTVYEYTIFAAYPHTSEHLLLCYDFADQTQFEGYFGNLSDFVLNANYDRDSFPAFGDKVLTLSTCYRLSRGVRYLVQGTLTATYAVTEETP
jgi:sortase B